MPPKAEAKPIKCVVWDLDNTVWRGTLLEGDDLTLRADARAAIETLDRRGILHSIASRNDHALAMERLSAMGMDTYFLCPQINWGAKSVSIAAIADALNLGLNAFAFVDDQAFEREEVRFAHPDILCLDGTADLTLLPDLPRMNPRFLTSDSQRRRAMYIEDFERREAEDAFSGTADAFQSTLDMRLTIAPASHGDLRRVEELTERTNQLNSTGYTFSFDELDALRQSPDHLLLVAELTDRFGSYGKIGLALVERRGDPWILKLLIVSCRVMSRGVGTILLRHVMRRAKAAGTGLAAEFRRTARNRIMHITYRFAGFALAGQDGDLMTFTHDLREIPPDPRYVDVIAEEPASAAEGRAKVS